MNICIKYLFVKYFSDDYIRRLDDKENKLKDDCLLNSERCTITARLRYYLEVSLFYKIDILF
jgi:hypothetical protein